MAGELITETAGVALPSTTAGKLYSPGQIAIATFLGSPIAGCWLLSRNYIVLGKEKAARQALLFGLLGTVLLLVLAFVLPAGFPMAALPTAYTLAIHEIAKQFQARVFASHLAGGGKRQSYWRVFGIGVLWLAVVCALVVGVSALLPDSAVS